MVYMISVIHIINLYIYIYKGVRGIDHISFLCICILAKLYKSDICITSTASSATSTEHKIHILHVPTAKRTETYQTQLPKHPKATCKILNMHPKTKPDPTVHLETWCRVRCSVSYTTSFTGLSTSLATTPTPAGLWKWKHLQGMHEHHIFHSPNAHQQKT